MVWARRAAHDVRICMPSRARRVVEIVTRSVTEPCVAHITTLRTHFQRHVSLNALCACAEWALEWRRGGVPSSLPCCLLGLADILTQRICALAAPRALPAITAAWSAACGDSGRMLNSGLAVRPLVALCLALRLWYRILRVWNHLKRPKGYLLRPCVIYAAKRRTARSLVCQGDTQCCSRTATSPCRVRIPAAAATCNWQSLWRTKRSW